MTEQIHMQLRVIATAGTAWVLPLLGIPVFLAVRKRMSAPPEAPPYQ